MRYTFQSFREHNFRSIFTRRLYELLWPIALFIFIKKFFPNSDFAKENWHLYSFLAIEAFNLFSILTSDSIKEIVLDTSKNNIEIAYYNIYQGNMEEKYSFADIKLNMEWSPESGTSQITFFLKKRPDIILKKDNFRSADLDDLSALLRPITSLKSI